MKSFVLMWFLERNKMWGEWDPRDSKDRYIFSLPFQFVYLGFNSEVISWRCLLVAVLLWPMCYHTRMPCRRHRTWHPTPSQYTDTGPTCRCAIHWCVTSHWNTQLPILMFWVRPDQEILLQPPIHTSKHSTLVLLWW